MPPMPTAWWLRPESIAARVGEQSAVVWKRVYLRPLLASRSAVGVRHGPPNALDAPKPTSSRSTTSTLGAPGGGRSGVTGGNFAPGALASYATGPAGLRSGIGSTPRWVESVEGIVGRPFTPASGVWRGGGTGGRAVPARGASAAGPLPL